MMAAEIGTILTSVGLALDMIWGLFSEFISMIATNALIFIPVGLALLAGCIGIATKVIRKFGVRGMRK
jgi:hypothetical protein